MGGGSFKTELITELLLYTMTLWGVEITRKMKKKGEFKTIVIFTQGGGFNRIHKFSSS